jgi:NAD(P)H-dependent FMN reductase
VNESSKFIFIIPEYNGSYPGILKVWIDGLSFPTSFSGKKGGMIGISDGTQGAALAMGHFSDVLNYLGMSTLALRPRFIQIGKNMDEGRITNADYIKFMKMHAERMLSF